MPMDIIIEQMNSENLTIVIIRLLVTIILAGLIGFEREVKNHSAGFRTHILVGIGSCLMMLLSLYGFEAIINQYQDNSYVRFDPARIPSYVISGIGFLGAGTIIVYGGTIRGLTTAATIWAVAGIGLVVGSGMYITATIATIVILLSLSILNNVEKLYISKRYSNVIEVVGKPELKINEILAILEAAEVSINHIQILNTEEDYKKVLIKLDSMSGSNFVQIMEDISSQNAVKHVSR